MFDALSPQEWMAIRLSLRVAIWATLVSLPLAVAIAFLLARGRFWGHAALNGLIHLPLILPPVVTGYILLLLFGRRGPIGGFLEAQFGIVLAFRWTGAALACGVMGFPLFVRAVRLSIEAVDRRLEDAAGSLGGSAVDNAFTVTLGANQNGTNYNFGENPRPIRSDSCTSISMPTAFGTRANRAWAG